MRFLAQALLVLSLAPALSGCLSLAIGDNSSSQRRVPECTRCGRDLKPQLCVECQAELWSEACPECAKLGRGHMCPDCQEKAEK